MSISISYHVYPSPLTNESRIIKEVETLKERSLVNKVVALGAYSNGLNRQETLMEGFLEIHRYALAYPISFFPRAARLLGYQRWLRSVKSFLLDRLNAGDIIHCHSLAVLPLCVSVKEKVGCTILYDAHELESERAGAGLFRRWYSRQLEKKHLPFVDEMWVVGDSIRQWYINNMKVTPQVIYNYPRTGQFTRQKNGENYFRQEFSIPNSALIYLYQGSLSRGRGIEKIVSAFAGVENNHAHLVFMGYGPFSEYVKNNSEVYENIHYLNAVPPEVVLNFTRQADVGIALIEPICLSYQYCLPNKLFEYMQAGLGILASNLPEIAKVLEKSDCGELIDCNGSIQELSEIINRISAAEVKSWKLKSATIAPAYTWEVQENAIAQTYKKLTFKE